jgi:hypothetical protein
VAKVASALGAAAGLVLCALAGSMAAADEPPTGAVFSGVMALAGRQVPLPEGAWTVAGHSYEAVPELDSEAYGAIESVVLFRVEDKKVVAFIVADANAIPIEEGWGTASECLGEDEALPVVVSYDASGNHTYCGFAGRLKTADGGDVVASWLAARRYAAANGLGLPDDWFVAGYRLSNRHDVIDLRYGFAADLYQPTPAAPAAAEPPATTTGSWLGLLPSWLGGGAEEPAAEDPALRGLADWLDSMHALVAVGFRNGLSGMAPMPMPWTAHPAGPAPIAKRRIEQLTALLRQGAITPAEFGQQQSLILSQQPHLAAEQISTGYFTLIKVAAEQGTGILPTFVGNLIVLGSLPQAATLLSIQATLETVHDYLTELAWNTWGPQRLREEPAIDFPGVTRPPD